MNSVGASGDSVPGLSDGAAVPAREAVAARWRDLRIRVISALALLPPGLLCLWLGGLTWLALLAAGGVGLGLEWRQMTRGRPRPGGLALAGMVYLGVPVVCLASLRLRPGGLALMLFLVVLVSCCDIGAYLVGRLLGGPKLAPRISPGKTWSGAVGGLGFGITGGVLAAAAAGLRAELGAIAVFALLLAVVAELGDLAESAIKRRFGVKDSGRLLPGHGGLLDRFDGLLATAPVACLLLAQPAIGAHLFVIAAASAAAGGRSVGW